MLGWTALLAGCSSPSAARMTAWDSDAAGGLGTSPPAVPPMETRLTLPAGTCPRLVTFDAGTEPSAPVDIHLEGPCSRGDTCDFGDTVECVDGGVRWGSTSFCTCDGVAWSCETDRWEMYTCAGPIACPDDPLPYASSTDAGAVLPTGACMNGDQCPVRTREQCDDGTTGTTSAYECDCAPSGRATWQCHPSRSTRTSCALRDAGSLPDPVGDAGLSSDGGSEFIRVEGDGAPYEMFGSVEFFYAPTCGGDAGLSGCLADDTAPCVSTDVTPGNTGMYTDRNGDQWTLTSTDIQPAPGQTGINGPEAEGTLAATAVRGGAVLHLVFTFRTPYRYVVC